jgi:cold shock CspA family protein/predicted RNA-binding Zn-ribbon protein involved in translation (DUF1610 family)
VEIKDANTALTKANTGDALNGRVLWFNKESDKGRIRGDDEIEYFVTLNAVAAGRSLVKHERVKFEAVSTPRGPRAIKVEIQSQGTKVLQRFIPALKTSEGVERFSAIMSANEASQMSFAKKIGYVGIAVACIGLLSNIKIELALIGGVIWLLKFAIPTCVRMSQFAYYTIPNSRDQGGNHRCIACGAKGIYRRTPYKSNSTLADCSKCGFELWSE